MLVTDVGYNAAGWVETITDPKAIAGKVYYDNLGRTTKTIENYVNGVVSDTDDKTTNFTYNGNKQMLTLAASLTGGGFEETRWVYGSRTWTGDGINSNDVLKQTRWPDVTSGAASVSERDVVTVDQLGATKTFTDRNGSVHKLTYDVLGRMTTDAVTTLGAGVDGAVRRLETAFDTQGNAFKFTSYDAATGGNVVNQVQRDFNGLGQMTKEYQEHAGLVNTGTSLNVQYAYSEMASGANHSRLNTMTYPNGKVLNYNYSTGLNDTISRLSSLSDTSGTLESYDFLGLGTVVRRAHPQPGVDLTYIKQGAEPNGDAGDQYTGLDRFDRIVDQRWIKTSDGSHTDRFQYGYDRNSNRLWRDNLVNTAFGEVYQYDNLNQITSFKRGTLNATKTDVVGSPTRQQGWDHDALGNFDSVTTDSTPQTRTHNKQNEITSIQGATTPTYDANGNLTRDETGRTFEYDAWNRLVRVKDSGGATIADYKYDALFRRVSETKSGTTTDFYYSATWQVLEERVSGNAKMQYVWSPVYVDAMILRDRDADGNGSLEERLWVQQDANFNVTGLLDGTGAVVERYAYDPFGAQTVYDASWTVRSGGSNFAFVYGFQGRPHDAVTGTMHFRRREYFPTVGRFGQLDPKGIRAGDVNFYRLEANLPTSELDPAGLDPAMAAAFNNFNAGRGGAPIADVRFPWQTPKGLPPIGGPYRCPIKIEGTSPEEKRMVMEAYYNAAVRIHRAYYLLSVQWDEVTKRYKSFSYISGEGKSVTIESGMYKFLEANRDKYLKFLQKMYDALTSPKARYIRCVKTDETHSDRNPMYTEEWRAFWIDWSQRTIFLRKHYWDLDGKTKTFWTAHEYMRFILQMEDDDKTKIRDVNGVQTFDNVLDWLEQKYELMHPRK